MSKCAYRIFGPVSDTVLVEQLRARHVDWQGPDNSPGLVLAEEFRDLLGGIESPDLRALAAIFARDRLCPSVDPPCTRVAGSLRARSDPNESPSPLTPQPFTQFSRCPHIKLAIGTTGSTIDRVVIDADSAIDVPAEHVCVELLGPTDWFDPAGFTGPFTDIGPSWDVIGAVRVCRTCDSVEVFGRLTEFQPIATPMSTIVRPIPRGARRVWFFGLPVLQVWQLFAGDPNLGGVLVGEIRIPANTVEAVEFLPGVSHIRNLGFATAVQVGWCWEIQPL